MGKNSLTKSTRGKKASKKPGLKSLRSKKFETWKPENPYAPRPDTNADKKYTSPELTGDYDPADAEKIRALLFKKFDLKAPEQTGGGKGPGGKGEEPPGPPSGEPPGKGGEELPLSRGMLGGIIAVALVFALLIGASIKNMDNFYIRQTGSVLEIWKGDFSPGGREKIAALPGAKAPEPIKDEYSRQEAFALAFDYYIKKAESMAEAEQLPDLNAIRDRLEKAKQFALTEDQKKLVSERLNRIEFLTLLYRADVAAEKQTRQGYKTSLESLEQAKELGPPDQDMQMVEQRINRIRGKLEKLQEESGDKGDRK
ncbi:MAG: hypothetical protein K9K82_13790 [Desulfobacteraceae bacterium]|nr:hypothetical protein [Desulfobacteraceae bacterium]